MDQADLLLVPIILEKAKRIGMKSPRKRSLLDLGQESYCQWKWVLIC